MAISFPQSTRALQSDRGRASVAGILIALILLTLWSAWFFLASITRYEEGPVVRTTRDDRVIAALPATVAADLRPGQTAFIRPQGAAAAEVASIPASVADVLGITDDNQVEIALYVQWGVVPPSLWGQELVGTVSVAVAQHSPAMLVAHAAGQFIDLPAVSVGPK